MSARQIIELALIVGGIDLLLLIARGLRAFAQWMDELGGED